MTKDFVVAIELGSSHIRGIAGKKNADGSINVLSLVQEDSSQFIRKGYVYNIDKTTEAIQRIVTQLSSQLKVKIKKVYVGIGGQSVHGRLETVDSEFVEPTKITQAMVDGIMDTNRATSYPNREILDVSVQEYKVDTQYQSDPVGIECLHFEGTFLNIVVRKSFYASINKCFSAARVPSIEIVLAPLALADVILTDQEKRLGCILVDMGASTTTISIYHKSILRHLVVIPIGSNNITKDIAFLNMDENDAERLKLAYADAHYEPSEMNEEKTYPIDEERTVNSQTFADVVEARLTEIIENIKAQIPSEYEGKLSCGFILTGGGSNLKHITEKFAEMIRGYKIRVAKTISAPVLTKIENDNFNNSTLNTILGIMVNGKDNCAGDDVDPNDLFQNPIQESSVDTDDTIDTYDTDVDNGGIKIDSGIDVEFGDKHPEEHETAPSKTQKEGVMKHIGNFFKKFLEDD